VCCCFFRCWFGARTMGGRCVLTLRVGSLIMALFFIGFFYVWRDSMTGMTWFMSYVWHDSVSGVSLKLALFFIGVFDLWHDSSHLCRDAFIRVSWRIHMCDVTHLCVWRDSSSGTFEVGSLLYRLFLCVTWLIDMCDMTPSYVWRDSSSGVFEIGSPLCRFF